MWPLMADMSGRGSPRASGGDCCRVHPQDGEWCCSDPGGGSRRSGLATRGRGGTCEGRSSSGGARNRGRSPDRRSDSARRVGSRRYVGSAGDSGPSSPGQHTVSAGGTDTYGLLALRWETARSEIESRGEEGSDIRWNRSGGDLRIRCRDCPCRHLVPRRAIGFRFWFGGSTSHPPSNHSPVLGDFGRIDWLVGLGPFRNATVQGGQGVAAAGGFDACDRWRQCSSRSPGVDADSASNSRRFPVDCLCAVFRPGFAGETAGDHQVLTNSSELSPNK